MRPETTLSILASPQNWSFLSKPELVMILCDRTGSSKFPSSCSSRRFDPPSLRPSHPRLTAASPLYPRRWPLTAVIYSPWSGGCLPPSSSLKGRVSGRIWILSLLWILSCQICAAAKRLQISPGHEKMQSGTKQKWVFNKQKTTENWDFHKDPFKRRWWNHNILVVIYTKSSNSAVPSFCRDYLFSSALSSFSPDEILKIYLSWVKIQLLKIKRGMWIVKFRNLID